MPKAINRLATDRISTERDRRTRVTIEELHSLAERIFSAAGLNQSDAALASDVLVTADSWGLHTHGTKLLGAYTRRLLQGGVRPTVPVVTDEGEAWARMDGMSTLGMIGATAAIDCALLKAARAGVAFVGLKNTCHIGPAGYYAYRAAQQGFIAIVMSNDTPSVSAPDGIGPSIGSNPIAYSIPHLSDRPILFDGATSTVAGGKVFAAIDQGTRVPLGWLTDVHGNPTTDPTWLLKGGALTPAAGHKGYGIALLIEMLASAVAGANTTKEVRSHSFSDPSLATQHGVACIVLNPSLVGGQGFTSRLRHAVAVIQRGADRALRLPGDHLWSYRVHTASDGIVLPRDVKSSLRQALELVSLTCPRWL
jgi:ureidoglycolate dehydrogenase (NAD+)